MAQGKTQKLSKNLVQRAENMVKEIEKTEKQLKKTLDRYNNLYKKKKVKDRQKEYKRLGDELKKTEQMVANVRKRSEDMEKEAQKFFSEWLKGLGGINDPELRAMSQDRLNDTRDRYGEIIVAGQKAGDQYNSFVSDLSSQSGYLELDMSDAAISGLAEKAQETNARAERLFGSIHELTKTTKLYVNSLK